MMDVYRCNTITFSRFNKIQKQDIDTVDIIPIMFFADKHFDRAIRNSSVRIFPFHVSYADTPETLAVYFKSF